MTSFVFTNVVNNKSITLHMQKMYISFYQLAISIGLNWPVM